MLIAIDARELAGKPTGVGRYLAEIVREWGGMTAAAAHEIVFCAPTDVACDGPLNARVAIGPGRGTAWEQRALPRLARDAGADVLFCPGYSGPLFASMPTVLAVHDVSFAAHPEWFRWREGFRRRLLTRAAARRAARVLTLTEFSKREIVEHLGVPAQKVNVIPPGTNPAVVAPFVAPSFSSANRKAPTRAPLVLYVGSIFNRRHLPETIEGFARLARRHPGAQLTVVGDDRTFPPLDLPAMARQTGHADRIHLQPYAPDALLSDLYRRARAFVFLSEYEGFGLTPLEALSAGIPIVVLDTPVAREVYGPAAIYVATVDPVLVERALEEALFDETVRARVLAHAPAIVARYSWRECARRVLDVLVECAR